LAGWLFTQKETRVDYFNKRKGKWQKLNLPAKTYAFNWLGSIVVVYHNPKRLDTFGLRKAEIKRILLSYPDGRKPIGINGPSICAPYAQHIRAQDVHRIDIFLAA